MEDVRWNRRPKRRGLRRVPSFLRPRLTVKYVLCSVAAIYFSYCILFRMPFFSSPLPQYTGPFDVGIIDIESPLTQPRETHPASLKGTGQHAFELETVLFSVFYPAAKRAQSDKPKHLWVSKPIALTAEGYGRFAHVNNFFTNKLFTLGLWTLAGSTTIPAAVDVPLRSEGVLHDGGDVRDQRKDFPVIVFSHGMASSRTSYTQWCAELASRGYIVAAVEHRDGSGPGSVVMHKDQPVRKVLHFSAADLKEDIDTAKMKELQLAFRQAEVEETVSVLRAINAGKGADIYANNPRNEGSDIAYWEGRLDMTQMMVAGHSYGATLALQALKNSPSSGLRFQGGIILDPGKSSGPLNHDIDVPILVVHSNSWSKRHSIFHGRPHFDVVKDLVNGVIERGHKSWFLTSMGTTHPSVTDAPLIEPMLLSWTTGATINVREGVQQYVSVSVEFLEFVRSGGREGVLKEGVSHPEYDKPVENLKLDKSIGKYWQIHAAPASS